MKQRIQNMKIDGKRIVLRCDFNVPIIDGKITDTSKIDKSLETINYLLEKRCSIVILSHLGKVKTEEDKKKHTLLPVANYLSSILDVEVTFAKETRSLDLETKVAAMKQKTILLLENTRHEDVPQKLESGNDAQLASYWAALGELFVMDAFGSAHRAHASTVGITKYLPSCLGFLMQKEIDMLDNLVLNPKKPFTVMMGGAKIEDKLDLINSLISQCDYLILSGALANTCLKALSFNVAASLVSNEPEVLEKVKDIMLKNQEKIILPLDAIVGSTYNKEFAQYRYIDKIETDDIIYDVGIKSIEKYQDAINKSSTVFVNGTVGMYEDKKFANGTKEIFEILSKCSATVVIGGGDSVAAAINLGYEEKFTNMSSGGGATLEYLANHTLPGIEAISEEQNYDVLDI